MATGGGNNDKEIHLVYGYQAYATSARPIIIPCCTMQSGASVASFSFIVVDCHAIGVFSNIRMELLFDMAAFTSSYAED